MYPTFMTPDFRICPRESSTLGGCAWDGNVWYRQWFSCISSKTPTAMPRTAIQNLEESDFEFILLVYFEWACVSNIIQNVFSEHNPERYAKVDTLGVNRKAQSKEISHC